MGIDVGATKTLAAVFDEDGNLIEKQKIPTNQNYDSFKSEIENVILNQLSTHEFKSCCCAFPGLIDYEKGIVISVPNLPSWQKLLVKTDIANIIQGAKIFVHNDAKLAGLSEATMLDEKYHKVLYVTISTGIGGGVIVDSEIDREFETFEPGQMIFEHNGKEKKWESFASGKAFVERYARTASEVDDPQIWKDYVKLLVPGFENMLANVQPDVVIVGGGLGAHFEKFNSFLETELKQLNNPLVPVPPMYKAKRPEEAVIYGCYEYIRQNI